MGRYEVQDTPSGAKTLVYRNGGETRLHSAYDPSREAERAAGAFTPGRANVIVAWGLALGHHLTSLARLFPDRALIVLERDREVADLAQKENPALPKNLTVITSPAEIPDALEEIDMASFRGAAVYRHRPSYLLDPPFYDALGADIQQYFTSRLSDMLTRFEFVGRWIENILGNIHHAFAAAPVRTLFGAFRGYPGIIVSAGPSLRRNVDLLANAREKALVVCVDTAFKIMEKRGVSPHIVMTLDAQRHSVNHFLGVRDTAPLLLADLVSFPAILRDYRGGRIISTTSKYYSDSSGTLRRETTPLMDWIERHVPPPGDIQSGGSVATSAFDLLLNLGCDPIVLVGQDLAYTGREIHCSGSHHNEGWIARIDRFYNLECINQAVIRKRRIKRVAAFGGRGEVVSDFVFDLYRGWFSDSARKVPVKVINATEGGARIDHALEMPLRQALDSMPHPKASPQSALTGASGPPSNPDPEPLKKAVEAALSELETIITLPRGRGGEDERIIAEASRDEVRPVLEPLLKKTRVYLARHPDIEPSRALAILAGDSVRAATKMRALLEKLRHRLDSAQT